MKAKRRSVPLARPCRRLGCRPGPALPGKPLYLVNDAAAEAIQFQIDLVRGWITDPDGNRIPVTDIYQHPMATKTLLKWTIELQALLQNVQQEQTTGEIKITEIQINRPGANGQKNILTDFNQLFSPCTMTDHKPFYQQNPDGTLQINFHTG